uniref:Uncharacterized protein n=1 Tax=Oryza brachyantha TaxID=4533 RepID=J3M700_ORYBR
MTRPGTQGRSSCFFRATNASERVLQESGMQQLLEGNGGSVRDAIPGDRTGVTGQANCVGNRTAGQEEEDAAR